MSSFPGSSEPLEPCGRGAQLDHRVPTVYDFETDSRIPVTQEAFDSRDRLAVEGQLKSILMRRLLNLDLDQLQRLRKLYDENFTGPQPKAKQPGS